MDSRWFHRTGPALSHALFFLAFFTVPLAVSARFADQFTSIKWYVLEALAVAWFLVERLLCRSFGRPAGLRPTRLAWIPLLALMSFSALGGGFAWGMQPLLARVCFLLLVFSSFWYFRRTGLRLTMLRAAVAAAAAFVIVMGLLQFAGLNPLGALTAGDQRSATFGNINMAAQFVGLALVVLLGWKPEANGSSRWALAIIREALIAGGLAYLYLLGTRSVALAVAAALVFLFAVSRLSMRTLLRAAAGATLLVVLVLPYGPDAAAGTHRRGSVRLRLAVWADTLGLLRDHPLGVGAGNFEQAFIPYALAGRSRPDERLVFRSPHNDYLRLLAEEGVVTAALAAGLLVLLGARLNRSPAVGAWRSPPGALLGSFVLFFAIEAFFQFPLEMAFPALMTAVILGLALACLEPPSPMPERSVPRGAWVLAGSAAGVVVAGGLLWCLVRMATAEYLFVNARSDVQAQERACALDARRLEACVEAAWLRTRAGDHRRARSALVAVLGNAPHFYPAIKLLGEDSLLQGDRDTGCRYLGIYDEMFRGRSSVHERVVGECAPETLRIVRTTLSIPHYGAFPLAPADAALRPAGERPYWK